MSSDTQTTNASNDTKNILKFKIIFNKEVYQMSLQSDKTVFELKQEIQSKTSVAPDMQKLIYKGKPISQNDGAHLADCGIKNNDKILMVGSTLMDITKVLKPSQQTGVQAKSEPVVQGIPFCKQHKHKAILDKGIPKNVMAGIKSGEEPLPHYGLKGLIDKYGKDCQLSFRLESDQFVLKYGDKTYNYNIQEVELIEDQLIDGHEEYSILLIQMRHNKSLWFYWVPRQYIKSIRKAFT